MLKTASLLAALAAVALVATPALAANHPFSCYDFAWQSQEMKDCQANPDKFKAMMHKGMMHKGMMHKAAAHKTMNGKAKGMEMKKDVPEKKS